jgi:exosortase
MDARRLSALIRLNRSHLALLIPLGCVLWAYWTTLGQAAERWSSDPQYSHGYLVPVFALGLLWLRRDRLATAALQPTWWGLPLLTVGIILRLVGARYYYAWYDAVSLLPLLAGIGVMMGGWTVLRWSWPAIAFLLFMIPLPYTLEVTMAEPLQRLATVSSTFALQILGLPALAEGNTILLNEVRIGIVEACSGLRMLVIFFALSTAVTLVIKRPLWEKLVIAASAIPIALVANITRITVTGVLHDTVGSEIANAVFHDLAGWLMMPLALGLLALELLMLKHLLIEPPPKSQVALEMPGIQAMINPTRVPWRKKATLPTAAPVVEASVNSGWDSTR